MDFVRSHFWSELHFSEVTSYKIHTLVAQITNNSVVLNKHMGLIFCLPFMFKVSHQFIFQISLFGESDEKRKNQLSCLFTFY
jgi:hypothetical protein